MAEIFSESTDAFGSVTIVLRDETGVHQNNPIRIHKTEVKAAGSVLAAARTKVTKPIVK